MSKAPKSTAGEPDWDAALLLANICEQTYAQYLNPNDALAIPDNYRIIGSFKGSAFNQTEELFGFVLAGEEHSILAFRGSGSAEDWISDFIARQTPYRLVRNAGRTHKGITDIYRSARSEILKLLNQLPRGLPLYITGHSLGGALATLAALDIAKLSLPSKLAVYTFGAPRVGDPRFVFYYNKSIKQHFRFQNINDLVPQLPPVIYRSPKTQQLYYYMHVKGEVLIEFNNQAIADNHALPGYYTHLISQQRNVQLLQQKQQ